MWVIDLADEIESDLSAFHRIDDPMSLDSPRYFRLARQLHAYHGAVRSALLVAVNREREQNGGAMPPTTDVSGAYLATISDPSMPGSIEYDGED